MKYWGPLPAVCLLLSSWIGQAAEPVTVDGLCCEHRLNPLGIEQPRPRFGWTLASPERDQRQTAYRVVVSNDAQAVWDSGKVPAERSANVAYDGPALQPGTRYRWLVRAWDKDDKPSAWSAPATFSTGLDQWHAQWIGHDAAVADSPFNTRGLSWVHLAGGKRELRRQFDLPVRGKIRRAVLALYADNQASASVNGTALGEAVRWDSTARLEVTAALRPGANVITIRPTHSDHLPPAVIGRLVVQFEHGDDWQLAIDGSWENAKPFGGTPWGCPSMNDHARVPASYLRKEFDIQQPIFRATAYVTALGAYQMRLNGKRVGSDELTPGWTDFHHRVQYQTYDVTNLLHQGRNAIGAILGDGWYASVLAFTGRRYFYGGKPRLLAQLVIESGPNRQIVTSDASWRAAEGPIRHADLMIGCEYDARREMPGWDRPGFDDHAWSPVTQDTGRNVAVNDVTATVAAAVKGDRLSLKVENDTLGGDPAYLTVKSLDVEYEIDGKPAHRTVAEHKMLKLSGHGLKIVRARYGAAVTGGDMPRIEAAVAEPTRRHEELAPVSIKEPVPGVYLFDLGQNMVGWARLKLSGTAGQRISVRYGEMLNPEGTLYTANLRGAPAADFYTLAGRGTETLEPYFTFHGFRYVELRGLTAKPAPDAVTGIVVHSAMQRTGQFECSSPLVNRLYHNIIWGQKGNYLEVPTDCPQRDERAGWTGDAQFFIPTAAYNFNVDPFFTRWLTTLCEDSQHADGTVAHVAPDLGLGSGSTAWGDAAIVCTYNVYRTYDDTRVVAAHYPAMERLLAWYGRKSHDLVANVGGFGDWLNLGGGASREVIDTAYYAYLSGLMAEMGAAIGNHEAAERYARLHDQIRAAFAKFFAPDGSLRGSSQTGYALAFAMNLVPDTLRDKAAAKFAGEIARFHDHLATGFIGTPRLLPALHTAGRDDLARRLLLQETFPSWLFQVKLGATTMWERWDGWTPARGFQDRGMNSFNHYAFGAVGEYLYGAVGGIRAETPGYKRIRIEPVVGHGLTWANASLESLYGHIACGWKLDGHKLTMDVTIPVNTTATVCVPGADARGDGGKPLGTEQASSQFAVGSGTYHFTATVE
jgi:alpha-L-rhamnosidase